MQAESVNHNVLRGRLIDLSVLFGMGMLVAGLVVSLSSDVSPKLFEPLSLWAAPVTLHLYSTMMPQAALAQTLWLLAPLVLLIGPIAHRSPVFIVLEISAFASTIIPAFPMSDVMEFAVRVVVTQVGVFALASLGELGSKPSGLNIIRSFKPFIHQWDAVVKGKYGPIATCVIGSEYIGWGYAMMASHTLAAFVLMLVGSLILCLFAWQGMKHGIPLSNFWFGLNVAYVVASVIKIYFLVAAGQGGAATSGTGALRWRRPLPLGVPEAEVVPPAILAPALVG